MKKDKIKIRRKLVGCKEAKVSSDRVACEFRKAGRSGLSIRHGVGNDQCFSSLVRSKCNLNCLEPSDNKNLPRK